MWSTVIFQVASFFFIYSCSIEILKTFYIMQNILMTKSQKSAFIKMEACIHQSRKVSKPYKMNEKKQACLEYVIPSW